MNKGVKGGKLFNMPKHSLQNRLQPHLQDIKAGHDIKIAEGITKDLLELLPEKQNTWVNKNTEDENLIRSKFKEWGYNQAMAEMEAAIRTYTGVKHD